MLEDIRVSVIEGYRAIGHGGVEVGGVLFGRTTPDGTTIEARRQFQSEHAFGPSLRLSSNDESSLEELLNASGGDLAGLQPVGWYRSYTRSAIAVKEGDHAVMDRYFRGGNSVLLLLAPVGLHNTQGMFFVRPEEGERVSATAVSEFLLKPNFDFLRPEVAIAEPEVANDSVENTAQAELPRSEETARIPARRVPKSLIWAGCAVCLAAFSLAGWRGFLMVPGLTVAVPRVSYTEPHAFRDAKNVELQNENLELTARNARLEQALELLHEKQDRLLKLASKRPKKKTEEKVNALAAFVHLNS